MLIEVTGRCGHSPNHLAPHSIISIPQSLTKTRQELEIHTDAISKTKMGQLATARSYVAERELQLAVTGEFVSTYTTFAEREQKCEK